MTPIAEAAIFAVDPERVAAFYVAVAGLEVADAQEAFIELISDLWRVTVIRIPAETAEAISLTEPVTRREETPIKLVLSVRSLPAAREAASTHGGMVDGPQHEWAWHGTTRCDGHDPEGNVFQLAAAR